MRLLLMLAVMASLYNIFLDIKLVQFGLLIKIAYVRADKHTVYKRPHQTFWILTIALTRACGESQSLTGRT